MQSVLGNACGINVICTSAGYDIRHKHCAAGAIGAIFYRRQSQFLVSFTLPVIVERQIEAA
jgi:hypothetical protein